jgi:hypothetical protein
MVETRDKTTTEGRGLGFSFAADNVVRGEPGADFEKRRPTYPLGDDPRGREIDFGDDTGRESYGSTRNQVYRAYRGSWPLEGQSYETPARRGQLQKPKDLRPGLPNRSVDSAALDAQKELDRALLFSTDFAAVFPSTTISVPPPGATFSPGDTLTVQAPSSHIRSLMGATLFIDGQPVSHRELDRSDQDSTLNFTFPFTYLIPSDRPLGPMDVTVQVTSRTDNVMGIIADTSINNPPMADDIQGAVGTLDGRKGQSTSSTLASPLLSASGYLRKPHGRSSVTVNIV